MSTLISIAIILVCVLLILIVLVQNSKGGGLASSFSSSNQVMGVRKTADFLEKATWSLATALLVLSLVSAAYNKPTEGETPGANSKTSATRSVGANKDAGTTTTAPAPATNPTPVKQVPVPAPKKP